jgi:hypothetical protein
VFSPFDQHNANFARLPRPYTGYFGGGDFEADEFAGGVEVEKDFHAEGDGLQAL